MNQYLVVVDMQKDFVDGSLGSQDAQAIVQNVVDKIKGWQGPIIATRDTHDENYLASREGKYLPVKHCIQGTEGWMLDANVQQALSEKENVTYLNKPSFGSLELAQRIEQFQKDDMDFEIELVGLCTDICVVSNAMILKAAFPEVNIRVDASCCAGVSVESHEASLKTMQCCQIDIL